MLFIIGFMVLVGVLGGLDWAALKFGTDSRTAELLKENPIK